MASRFFAFMVSLVKCCLAVSLMFVTLCVIGPGTFIQAQANPTASADKMKAKLIIQSGEKRHNFSIEIADDDATRAKGLMYRTKIAPDHGMLFDFEKTEQVYMWMKNTYLSLDMLFVSADGTIRHIVKNTTPLSLSIISSGGPVRYVLEVKAGTADRLALSRGDRLLHQLFTPPKAK